MSEATEVTEIVERVREHLAAAVGIGHPDEEGYIDFLTEILAALTAATQRADAAEAMRDDIIAICRGTQLDDAAIHSMRTYVEGKLELEKLAHGRGEELGRCLIALSKAEAERDALRKDAARLDWLSHEPVFEGFADSPLDVFELESIVAEQNGRYEPTQEDRREAFRRIIDTAMAVQPTTGEGA